MRIGDREIGLGHKPYIIAEIGVNHDGDVARALELTDAAADAGADAVKLQYFETDRLMSKAAKLAAYQKAAGETDPIEMLRRLELTLDEMGQVVDRAHAKGIHAIVTVFSMELVERAETLVWDAYKTASPDIVNKPLLERLLETGKPLIVSTGASTLDEVVRAVDWLEEARDRLAVLQCVSSYPAPNDGLGGIVTLRESLSVPVGYSDHTRSVSTGEEAVHMGSVLLEKHITDDCKRKGPDHAASLHLSLLRQYCDRSRKAVQGRHVFDYFLTTDFAESGPKSVHDWNELPDHLHEWILDCDYQIAHWAAESAMHTPIQKEILNCERDVREVARQSIVAAEPIAAGTTITRSMLTIKRPGTGILGCDIDDVVGAVASRDIEHDVPVVQDDLLVKEHA